MAALGQRRRKAGDLDVEIDMVPIMNMFLVLIPFLLSSASFLNLKAINTSVPVQAETASAAQPEQDKKPDIKITATVKLQPSMIKLEATSSELSEDKLKALDALVVKDSKGQYQYADLAEALGKIKQGYPKSDTVILVPSDSILYDDIVATMDVARQFGEEKLFPNVVISGQVQ